MNHTTVRGGHSIGDYLYDAFHMGAIGGGLVAMFFLLVDVATRDQALFTPSLLGKVLFERVPPEAVQSVDMMAVARYSVVHFLAFGLLGLGLSILAHQAEIRSRHPVLVIALVFVILEAAFWLGATFAIPGVLERLGVLPVAAANLIAAGGVGLYLVGSHRAALGRRAGSPTPPD